MNNTDDNQDPEIEVINDDMLVTDDDLTTDTSSILDESESEIVEEEQDNVEEESEEEVSTEEDSNTEEEDAFENFSVAALQAKLFEEQGLKIYEELDKDLTLEEFAADLPEYINQSVEARFENKVQEFGRMADYVRMMTEENISQEVLQPALQAEKIASFDLNDNNITEEDLLDIVIKTELRKGRDEEEAKVFANAIKANGLDYLKARAAKDVEWTGNYIEDIKSKARQNFQQKEHERQMQEKEAHDIFVQNLRETIPNKSRQQEIYDFNYKRNQLVTYKDEQGQDKQTYMTPYEIEIYKIQQDPAKQVMLMDFLMSGMKGSRSERQIENNINQKILEEMKKKTSGNATVRKAAPQRSYQSEVSDDEGIKMIGDI